MAVQVKTKEEFVDLLDQGCGYCSFMGGTSSKNGKEILEAGDHIVLFEQNEIGNEEWRDMQELLRYEAEEHLLTFAGEYMNQAYGE